MWYPIWDHEWSYGTTRGQLWVLNIWDKRDDILDGDDRRGKARRWRRVDGFRALTSIGDSMGMDTMVWGSKPLFTVFRGQYSWWSWPWLVEEVVHQLWRCEKYFHSNQKEQERESYLASYVMIVLWQLGLRFLEPVVCGLVIRNFLLKMPPSGSICFDVNILQQKIFSCYEILFVGVRYVL